MVPSNLGTIRKVYLINIKGDTISKIKIGEPIVSMHLSDLRTKGTIQLLCVCKTSTVKAYNLDEQ